MLQQVPACEIPLCGLAAFRRSLQQRRGLSGDCAAHSVNPSALSTLLGVV